MHTYLFHAPIAVILLINVQLSGAGVCDNVPHTFSYNEVVFCNGDTCRNDTIDGCLEDQTIKSVRIVSPLTSLKRGAIKNMEYLESIILDAVSLKEIHPRAFLNLPRIFDVVINNNDIEVVPTSVFSKMSTVLLVLDFNNIKNIENYAFADMQNLKHISLRGNLLRHVKKNWFLRTNGIEYFDLSENELVAFDMDVFSEFVVLKQLRLQFNGIRWVKNFLPANTSLNELNLAGNNLTDFGVLRNISVRSLHLSMNKITTGDLLHKSFVFSNALVVYLYLHPNPWLCSCLRRLESMLQKQNVHLSSPRNDPYVDWSDPGPLCIEHKSGRMICGGTDSDDIEDARREYFKNYQYKYKQKTKLLSL